MLSKAVVFFTCIAIQPAVEAARDVSPQLVEAENTMKDLAAERAQAEENAQKAGGPGHMGTSASAFTTPEHER
jgi:hypothetical protein